jgi:hypothetical protein
MAGLIRVCGKCDGTGNNNLIDEETEEITGSVTCSMCNGEKKFPSTQFDLSDITDMLDDILNKCNDILEKLNE